MEWYRSINDTVGEADPYLLSKGMELKMAVEIQPFLKIKKVRIF